MNQLTAEKEKVTKNLKFFHIFNFKNLNIWCF